VNGIHHPFTDALYELEDPETRTIRVTDGDRTGVFTRYGRWIEGELRECDPHLCGWIGGPQVMKHRLVDPAE